jgi:hypothetical protein
MLINFFSKCYNFFQGKNQHFFAFLLPRTAAGGRRGAPAGGEPGCWRGVVEAWVGLGRGGGAGVGERELGLAAEIQRSRVVARISNTRS